mmetsp:Transcript_6391/g.25967  ORF Transcript_6391/g.25967 Transcript_6391/m.25967 type:complete len:393 (+) Transcript_6391:109-1287(+)
MHAGFPKPGAANLIVAVIFMSFCGLTRRKNKMNGRSGGFDALTGVPALRPSEDEIKEAKTKCLSKPITTEKLSIKTIMVVVHGKKCEDGKGKRHLREIRDLAEARGLELVEVRTEREGHCEELVRDANFDDIDAVGVMGGDGTFREGVCGMIARSGDGKPGGSSQVPIFAFPCGTGNNYARDLGQRTVADVFDAIARGRAHAVDAVKVEHPNGMTYSINCVTWGMARDAAATAENMRWLGAIRYDVAGFFHIMKNKLNYANLAAYVDGEVTSSSVTRVSDSSEADEDYLMMFAQNTRCSGRGFPFTPLAKLDDGAFDLIAVKKCGVLKTVGLFEAVKKGGSHVRDPSVCYVKVKKATLEASDSADLVGIDGEVDVTTPINLEIAEGAFKTFV